MPTTPVTRSEARRRPAESDRQVDVQRLMEEVAHTAMAMLDSTLVWLLALDSDHNRLVSEMLTTRSGSREEADFLLTAGGQQGTPDYALEDTPAKIRNPSATVPGRRTTANPVSDDCPVDRGRPYRRGDGAGLLSAA